MPAKDRAKRRATWNAWYHRTKGQRVANVPHRSAVKRVRRQDLASWMAELKSQLVCARCGQDHPACLVFHHVDPTTKEITVSRAVMLGWGRARVLREVAKCIVLCANCHFKLHEQERSDADARS